MEASHFLQSGRSFAATLAHSRHAHEHNKLRHCSIAAVLTRPAENINIATGKSRTIIIPADVVTGAEEKSRVYNDNWFDRMAINHLSQNVQAATGFTFVLPFIFIFSRKGLKQKSRKWHCLSLFVLFLCRVEEQQEWLRKLGRGSYGCIKKI